MRARTPAKLDSFARCRAPHHGPQSRRRFSFSAPPERRAPSLPSSEAVCMFSARARPLSLHLVSPRGALSLPSLFPLGDARAFASVCSVKNLDISVHISAHVRVMNRRVSPSSRDRDSDLRSRPCSSPSFLSFPRKSRRSWMLSAKPLKSMAS